MDKKIILSYLTMRKVIGILAIAFPFILIIGGMFNNLPIQDSLSAYYWTNAMIAFTGMLITFGIFLLAYNGYDKKDEIITTIAGVAMLMVAIFPMIGPNNMYLFAFLSTTVVGLIHYIAATITFSALGIMSFFQFTKSGEHEITVAKGKRNIVYRVCGITIGVAIITMAITNFFFTVSSIFWLESIIVWAFGVSWLVKGEAILKD